MAQKCGLCHFSVSDCFNTYDILIKNTNNPFNNDFNVSMTTKPWEQTKSIEKIYDLTNFYALINDNYLIE